MPKDAKDAMILDYRDGIKSFPSFSLYFYLRMETLTRINMVTIPNGEQYVNKKADARHSACAITSAYRF